MLHVPRLLRRNRLSKNVFGGVIKLYAKAFRHRFLVERRMGALLLLDQINAVDRNLLVRGVWEEQQIDHLEALVRKHARPGERPVFLDIGAHTGLYSLVLGARVDFAEMVAFEPVPGNLVQLRANLWLNDALSRIRVVEKAVADRPGRTQFVVSLDKNRGHSRIADDERHVGETLIEVEVTTVDDVVDWRDRLVVAKLDVEGGELNVLRGMTRTLGQNRAVLQVEYFAGPLSDVADLLRPFGLVHESSRGYDHFFVTA